MSNRTNYRQLYRTRKLSHGYPDLGDQAVDHFSGYLGIDSGIFDRKMPLIDRLIDLEAMGSEILVVGCGPKPSKWSWFSDSTCAGASSAG